jgi:AcrR family transcriptional regulator
MSAREKILDAAAQVMLDKGLVGATTKEIARQAGYSEATLYKYFADKQDIFIGVLRERVPSLDSPADLVGTGSVAGNLQLLTAQLIAFYQRSFPMAASIISAPELLATWREGIAAKRAGPDAPLRIIERYLTGEIKAGNLTKTADPRAMAALLCGAAMQQAFLAHFAGKHQVPAVDKLAAALVAALRLDEPNNRTPSPPPKPDATS